MSSGYDLIIIGAGAAGLTAGVFAARKGLKVLILEKNEKPGKKLFITGKGRCNFTNASDADEHLDNIVTNKKFMYSSEYGFTSADSIRFFESLGLKTKIERGKRAFPASNHSSDVIKALIRETSRLGVRIMLNTEVSGLIIEGDMTRGVRTAGGKVFTSSMVLVATGGVSYPLTGSTGDGYRFAKDAGLRVKTPRPALVPLITKEDYIPQMQGLSLKNAGLTLKKNGRTLYYGFGEMLFTHFGISGPLALTASSFITSMLPGEQISAYIDLKTALDEKKLDDRLLREFGSSRNKHIRNAVAPLFPAKLLPVVLEVAGIDPVKPVNEITKKERKRLISVIKAFPFTIEDCAGLEEAIITQGGVDVKEIDPSTMECRKIKGLYFAGEVIDVDALTGGFNLQIAFCTAFAAACAAADNKNKERTKMHHHIAIDGPSGAGKSTIAKEVAKRFGYNYMDTGAMYRTVGLFFSKAEKWPETDSEIETLARKADIDISFKNGKQIMFLNGEDVTDAIRTEEVGMLASKVSAYPKVRELLVAIQQKAASGMDVVMDGRDIGTVVLPDAELKIFLTADVNERANRRFLQLKEKGEDPDLDKILKELIQRDYQDTHREHSPLKQADDAVLVDSTDLTIKETVDHICELQDKVLDGDR